MRYRWGRGMAVGVLLCLVSCLLAAASIRQTEEQLRALRQRIEQATRAVTDKAAERDRATRSLRSAELAVAEARRALSAVLGEQQELDSQRAALERERAQQETRLAEQRERLAAQMRIAYVISRNEPLKLLLNRQDPLRQARILGYYGYLGRARAAQLEAIREGIARLAVLDGELEQAGQRLAELRSEREQRVQQLDARRKDRERVLVAVRAEARSRSENLAKLKSQQADLEQLLSDLNRSLRSLPPPDVSTAFGRLRGKLEWPVSGRLVASYGEQRAATVRWEAMVVATERGAPVRAVAAGRVLYADWLGGMGLLMVIDHGDQYLSLYGFNEQLQREVGSMVAAGDVIAAAGDSGGRSRPELYFELRRSRKPIDPRPWFREPQPAR